MFWNKNHKRPEEFRKSEAGQQKADTDPGFLPSQPENTGKALQSRNNWAQPLQNVNNWASLGNK